MEIEQKPFPPAVRAYLYLGTLVVAYIGIYLSRKNLSVAVPMLEKDWGINKAQVGIISSVSTVTYAAGKFLFGPVTDRIGGRASLLGSMTLVALFGLLGGLVPSLAALTIVYSLNRLAGSASWGAMLKQVPDWFRPEKLAFTCGLLSLSFVFGGAVAVSFAGLIARLTHDSWPAVLACPSLALALLVVVCGFVLPRQTGARSGSKSAQTDGFRFSRYWELFRERKFIVVAALSFTLTLLRETFNFWTVDFIRTEGGPQVSNSMAAFLSIPFDLCGALGIVLMGWVFGRLHHGGRQCLLVAVLGTLTLLLMALPSLFHLGLWALATSVGLIGFLAYGPYSLLAGVLAVEVRGQAFAATVSGLVDGAGYFAGFLSGIFFGKLLMLGGYQLGFEVMAGLTLVSAILCCFLYRKNDVSKANSCPESEPLQREAVTRSELAGFRTIPGSTLESR
ncbi:MAG TPA: MFS transporter [Candidatus Limnocylindrales bacterium]|nr:MFS transporter [Candidatus Limnocylindrales bacterium]